MILFRSITIACITVALLLACVPGFAAAPPSDADIAAAEAKMAEGKVAADSGDEATALRLIGEAARLAHSGELAHKLGHLYEGRTQQPGYEAKALEWFLYAAELRQADAMHHVGQRYLDGSGGLERNVGKGLELMEASAEAGYHPAYGVASKFRKEQDQKARCLLAALRGQGMRDVPFGATELFQIRSGEGSNAAGDVYRVSGFSDDYGSGLAALDVDGFRGADYVEINGRWIYSDVYTSGAASADGERLAARLRAECKLAE